MRRGISRREVTKGLVAGAALLAVRPSCRSVSRSAQTAQLLRNDLPDLNSALLIDDVALQAAGDDFGHFVHQKPIAVLTPRSVEDIIKMVRFANRRDLKLATRGQGHAMFGQTQLDAGVVIDSSTLNSIRLVNFEGHPAVESQAGARWGDVIPQPTKRNSRYR